jgi:hypothetical protein
MFSDLWVRQHLMSHDYFKKGDKILWTDLSIAAHGFFLYYKGFVSEYFPGPAEIDSLIVEDIQWGIRNSQLICQVPYQKRVEKIEYDIRKYSAWIKGLEIEAYDQEAVECASALKKSISLAKIKRLFRWGYLEAQQLIPYSPMNVVTVRSFLREFHKISKKESLYPAFDHIEFDIEDGALLQWSWCLIKFNGERVHYKAMNWCLK